MTAPTKNGFNITFRMRKFLCLVHISNDPRVTSKVRLYILLSFPLWDFQKIGQTKRALAVDDAKVDCLCTTAKQRIHITCFHIEDLASSYRMNICTISKRVSQHTDICYVGKQPELNL